MRRPLLQNSTPLLASSAMLAISMAGWQGEACARSSHSSCYTPLTATATTPIGASMLQAGSLSRRISAVNVMREKRFEQEVRDDRLQKGLGRTEVDVLEPQGLRDTDGTLELAEHARNSTEELGRSTLRRKPDSQAFQVAGKSWLLGTYLTPVVASLLQEVVAFGRRTSITEHVFFIHAASARAGPFLIVALLLIMVCGGVFVYRARAEAAEQWEKDQLQPPPSRQPRVLSTLPTRSPASVPTHGRQDEIAGSRIGTAISPVPGSATAAPLHISLARSDASERDLSRGRVGGDASAASRGAGADRPFCDELVVPQHCECILVVPGHNAPPGRYPICDVNGRAVLYANTRYSGGAWQLVLQTASGDALAHCSEVRHSIRSAVTGDGHAEFTVSDAQDEFFASFKQVQEDRFELASKGGLRLSLWGNFKAQAINVTDSRGVLLATTEPTTVDHDQVGVYYKLRVAPLANVGHALCALFCIGQILKPG